MGLTLLLGTAGVKFNPAGNRLISANVLFPLTSAGDVVGPWPLTHGCGACRVDTVRRVRVGRRRVLDGRRRGRAVAVLGRLLVHHRPRPARRRRSDRPLTVTEAGAPRVTRAPRPSVDNAGVGHRWR
jgi:hypothetical protein